MALTLSRKAQAVKPSATLAITAKAKQMRANGIDVVGFGAGEPDFDTPDNICEAAVRAIQEGFTKYTPASGTKELKEAISKKFREFNHLEYSCDQIVVSNGGKHSLMNIFAAILNPGDEVLIPAPFWLSYPEMVRLNDGVPVFVYGAKENGYKVTASQIREACTEKTKAVIINSPCNPTGMVYTRQELSELAEVIVEQDIYAVSDEMYENLIYGGAEHVSIASLGEEIYKRTITCSGLSKSYSMTGWRLGYTGSSAEIASLMGSVQSHATSNPNSIAQKAAVEALNGPQDTIEEMKKAFDARRSYMLERVRSFPYVEVQEPKGAFYLYVDISGTKGLYDKDRCIEQASDVAELLLSEYAVAVVPCADFGGADCIRLSYAISMEEITKGLDRIQSFLEELREWKK